MSDCQFKKINVPRLRSFKKVGFEAFIAVYRNDGEHVCVGAPSLRKLRDYWRKLCPYADLDDSRVQKIFMLQSANEPVHIGEQK